MELPKLKKENLSKELREVVGDNDLEFDSLVDPTDVMNLAVNLEESRKRYEELRKKVR